jgi:hypothetical protein
VLGLNENVLISSFLLFASFGTSGRRVIKKQQQENLHGAVRNLSFTMLALKIIVMRLHVLTTF